MERCGLDLKLVENELTGLEDASGSVTRVLHAQTESRSGRDHRIESSEGAMVTVRDHNGIQKDLNSLQTLKTTGIKSVLFLFVQGEKTGVLVDKEVSQCSVIHSTEERI